MKKKASAKVQRSVFSTNSLTKRAKQESKAAMKTHLDVRHFCRLSTTCKPLSHGKESPVDEEGSLEIVN